MFLDEDKNEDECWGIIDIVCVAAEMLTKNYQWGVETFAQHITVFKFCVSVLQNIFLFLSFLF